MSKIFLSVAIVTRNREEKLLACLQSLIPQKKHISEIVIVDNGSTDFTKKLVFSFNEVLPVRYIFEPLVGIPFARNRALQEVNGDIVAFIDDDCEVDKKWARRVLRAHQNYPKALAIQGEAINIPVQGVFSQIFKVNHFFWMYRNTYQRNKLIVCDTKNLSLKMAMVKKYNLAFDTRFLRGSDVDMAKQIRRVGQEIIYQPTILCYHKTREKVWDFLKQSYRAGKYEALLQRKWPSDYFLTNEQGDKYEKLKKGMLKKLSPTRKLFVFGFLQFYKRFYPSGFYHALKNKPFINRVFPLESLSKKSADVAVAIATRNRAGLLSVCLGHLSQQTVRPKEVLVIDNGSSDNTREIVDRYAELLPIRYIFEKSVGTPHARNRALQEAKGSILAFTDDDCEVRPDWIERIVIAHKKNPRAIAIQGKSILSPTDVFAKALQKNYEQFINKNRSEEKIFVIDTSNVSVKIKEIRNIKVQFDARFKKYCDDTDFCMQLLLKQKEVCYDASIVIYTYRKSLVKSLFKERFEKGIAKAVFDKKWFYYDRNNSKIYVNSRSKYYLGSHSLYKSQRRSKQIETDLSKRVFFSLKLVKDFLIEIINSLIKKVYELGYQYGIRTVETKRVILKKSSSSSRLGISVGIITKNRERQLHRCLRALVMQTKKMKELVIIDSSTDDAVKKLIESYSFTLPIRYFYEKEGGIAHARNVLFEKTRGEILCCIDDDCEAAVDWIEKMVEAHKKYPRAAAIQGRSIVLPYGGVISRFQQFEYNYRVLKFLKNTFDLLFLNMENASFKMSLFRKIKLENDERYKKFYYGEDEDFGFQLVYNGLSIKYVPEAVVGAWRKLSLTSYVREKFLRGAASAVIFYKWNVNASGKNLILKRRTFSIGKQFMTPKNCSKLHFYPEFHYFGLKKGDQPRIGKIGRIIALFTPFINRTLFKSGYYFGKIVARRRIQDGSFLEKKILPIDNANLKLSVIIITKDRYVGLVRVLDSLTRQKRKPYEVIVVDASEKKEKILLEGHKKLLPLKHIPTEKIGFSSQRNIGLQEATGDIFATIDDDCEVPPDWSRNVIRGHEENKDAVALQGSILSKPEGSAFGIFKQLEGERWFGSNMLYEGELTVLSTKNASFKRSYVKRFNITFTENNYFNTFGGEDVDFAKKILKNNGEIRYVPQIKAIHWERVRLHDFIQQQYRKGCSKALLKKGDGEKKKQSFFLNTIFFWSDLFMMLSANNIVRRKMHLLPYVIGLGAISLLASRKGYFDTRILLSKKAIV